MDPREFPTKGNLMLAKNSLALANQGYELMDKKRNILLKELMGLIDEAKGIQEEIDSTFTQAYACLQRANIEMGISRYRNSHSLYQLKIPFVYRLEVLWEQRFHISNMMKSRMT